MAGVGLKLIRSALAGPWLAAVATAAMACPPPEAPRERLRGMAAMGWDVADGETRQALAVALLQCLASPDPHLRDELAFAALSSWVRAGLLTTETLRQIGEHSMTMLDAPDSSGFGTAFAALTLAEIARADRLQPIWSATERQAVVGMAARFVHQVKDYRGFDAREGWRHAVAHGADLLMQLSLNPALDRGQLDLLLGAVASQWLPSGHFYIYGEGERLARPVLFIARRRLHSAEEWSAWLARLSSAATPTREAPTSQEALARTHNAKSFLLPLYANLQEGSDAELRQRLLPGVVAALRRLP